MPQHNFDAERAINLLDAFGMTSGLGATLFSPHEGQSVDVIFSRAACHTLCPRCNPKADGAYWPEDCLMTHRLAALFADNYNSSYIYLCPEEYLFFAAPIVADSRIVAAATMGPVHLVASEDADEESNAIAAEEAESTPEEALGYKPLDLADSYDETEIEPPLPITPRDSDEDGVPMRSGEYLQRLALMFSSALYSVSASTEGYTKLVNKTLVDEPNSFAQGNVSPSFAKDYPVTCETDLLKAVRDADAASARHALNELLGYLLSSSLVDSRYLFRERIDELMAVTSHAALRAGVSAEVVFPTAEKCRKELNYIGTEDQMCSRLHHFVEQMIEHVQKLYDIEFDDFKYRALSYIHANYRHHVSLEDAADTLGFSTSHFSRSFKDHMGCTFITYLNEVRVQAAKSELIATDTPVANIGMQVGFENTSYFIRVFKRIVGMTPGSYRMHRGQLGNGQISGLEPHHPEDDIA